MQTDEPVDSEVDVAVIGYGPTGLVAASLLGRAGHRVLVVERWSALYGLPRFTHVDGEVARILSGAADVERALRDSGPTSLTFVNGAGQTLIHVPAGESGPQGFPDHLSVHQPDIEEALDERVRSHPSVEVGQGWELTALTQDGTGATLTLTGAGGTRRVRARWVIGADGARSRVRDLLGVACTDLGFTERWVNYDAEWLGEVPDRFSDTTQTCDPARGRMTMRIGAARQRFEFAVAPDEDTDVMQEADTAWALLGEHYGVGPDDVRLLRRVVYTFRARIADRWTTGRVFLAGDAAHTMPPYLGQGACSGIRDAANLAWKLDLVLRGAAPDSLLATYEAERRPHATALVHGSVALGRIANTRDPVQAAGRDAAFLAGRVPPPPPVPPMSAGVLQYRPDGAPVPPVGTVTPQGAVRRGGRTGRLTEVTGGGFTLLTAVAPDLDEARRAFLAGIGCQVVHLGEETEDVDGVLTSFLDGLPATACLIRPDFVLFGAAGDGGAAALVDDLATSLVAVAVPA